MFDRQALGRAEKCTAVVTEGFGMGLGAFP